MNRRDFLATSAAVPAAFAASPGYGDPEGCFQDPTPFFVETPAPGPAQSGACGTDCCVNVVVRNESATQTQVKAQVLPITANPPGVPGTAATALFPDAADPTRFVSDAVLKRDGDRDTLHFVHAWRSANGMNWEPCTSLPGITIEDCGPLEGVTEADYNIPVSARACIFMASKKLVETSDSAPDASWGQITQPSYIRIGTASKFLRVSAMKNKKWKVSGQTCNANGVVRARTRTARVKSEEKDIKKFLRRGRTHAQKTREIGRVVALFSTYFSGNSQRARKARNLFDKVNFSYVGSDLDKVPQKDWLDAPVQSLIEVPTEKMKIGTYLGKDINVFVRANTVLFASHGRNTWRNSAQNFGSMKLRMEYVNLPQPLS